MRGRNVSRASTWFAEPAPAQRLAALRIVLGAAAWIYAAARFPDLIGVARLPTWQFKPVGPVTLLGAPLPSALVVVLAVATLVVGIGFVIGMRWRITGPTFAALLLWVVSYRNSWGMVFHTENLMVLHVAVLAASRAADTWSIDARRAPTPEPSARYGAPIRVLAVVTLVTYFIAGYSKLANAGLAWITSDTLCNYVAYDNLRKAELGDMYSPLGAAMVRNPGLFPPLAAFSLLVEVGAPLVVIHRRLGQLWCVAAWSFHLGVLATMWIVFHYPLLGLAYAPFFAIERPLARLGAKLRR
jgi:uncharacterized membrane protein YphA (DoxX/SURF4 family)